ncbi:MAG: NAD(+)/NADH kinase [Candidatus Heimdallarchaeaceae archaeon]
MKIALFVAEEENFVEFAKTIKDKLTELSEDISIIELEDKDLKDEDIFRKQRFFPSNNVNMIISVGDTGTFLRAIFLGNGIVPVVAASSEQISFFTEITPMNIDDSLKAIISKSYSLDEYSRVILQDTVLPNFVPALNEIAIFPEESAQLMRYTLTLDNNVLYRGRADGLIIATPLGSTGYALSANGPIAYGNPEIMIIVPVNPLNKDHLPLVVPLDVSIQLTNLQSKSAITAIIDGQIRQRIGQEIVITKAKQKAKVIRFSKRTNILARLRNRLVELDLQSLEGVPPSAKYIFKLLHTEGEMTQSELIQSTGLPSRTVRNALKILKKKGVVGQRPYLHDARQSIYFIL